MKRKPAPLRLIVGDTDKDQCENLRCHLELAGYEVIAEVDNGGAALEAARRLRPDLVILDVKLLCLDGIAVAHALLSEERAPVILLADSASPYDVRRAAQAGVFQFLTRPVREAALLAAIEITRTQWITLQQRTAAVRRLQEKEATRAVVDEAKRILIRACDMNETRAYRLIQTRSMNTRRTMRQVAEQIIDLDRLRQTSPNKPTKARIFDSGQTGAPISRTFGESRR